jgi:hypothetical protein
MGANSEFLCYMLRSSVYSTIYCTLCVIVSFQNNIRATADSVSHRLGVVPREAGLRG